MGENAFHYDVVAQIRMDHWSRGRVALLGDAGYCCSPLTGQGTSAALTAAYVLAGELHAAGGDHRAAFASYQERLRDHVTANQALFDLGRALTAARDTTSGADGGTDADPTDAPGFDEPAPETTTAFRAAMAFDPPDC
ncbi:hypothetical protein GCM10010211_74080 [Streptomyces albospinus]|uniref:FAD-binding domain-containing protein n=1 Tax=Streptomyces albospinus TaxID=285515 RepID=A0ABQ2VLD0_9ACTN|nr:FAD-dependent monooxygenase [Streptomyces albospinus]GGU96126.1 hypothetical protein GCM10010211_74080 [Streptomyces albospinus]